MPRGLPPAKVIISGEDRTRQAFASAERRVEKFGKSTARVLGAIGAGIGLEAFRRSIASTVSALDDVGKFATATGISVEAVQSLSFAAQQSGVDIGQLEQALVKTARGVGQAASGFGEARLALQTLGIDARELVELPIEDQFRRIVSGLNQIGNTGQRVQLATQIFGEGGAPLLQLADNVTALESEFRNLGVTVSEESVKAAEDAADSFGRLKTTFLGIRNETNADLLPSLARIADFLTDKLPPAANATGKAFSAILGTANLAVAGLLITIKAVKNAQLTLVQGRDNLTKFISERAAFTQSGGGPMANVARARLFGSSGSPSAAAKAVQEDIDTFDALILGALGRASDLFNAGDRFDDSGLREIIITRRKRALNTAFQDSADEIEEIEIKRRKRRLKKLNDSFTQMELAAARGFANAGFALQEFFFDPAEKGIAGFVDSFITGIRRVVAEIAAQQVLLALFGGTPFARFLPGFADGGFISSGQPAIVGERGPELFIPGKSGQIIPNGKLGGLGGGAPTFVTTVNVEAGVDARILEQLPVILEQERRRTISEFFDLTARGRVPV